MYQEKKIIITGAKGMMGSDVVPILSENYSVVPTDKEELDITDAGQIEDWFDRVRPDWVVHMAALTDLDFCEENPDIAHEVNNAGTEKIAAACKKRGIGMIYISTSGIFSGKKDKPYTEDDIPKPVNVYGQSKYHGELAVQKILEGEKWMILRAGWLFGGGENDIKFVGKMIKLARTISEISAVDNIFGSPNYTVDIGRLICYLIEEEMRGVFHVGNEGLATRLDLAEAIVELSGADCTIKPVHSSVFPTKAPRPPMEAIVNSRLLRIGYEMRPWREALKDYIERLR